MRYQKGERVYFREEFFCREGFGTIDGYGTLNDTFVYMLKSVHMIDISIKLDEYFAYEREVLRSAG